MESPDRKKFPLLPSFSHGLADFQKRLSPEQIQEFQFATFQSLQASIENIQKEQAKRHGFRNLNKIRPFIDGLTQYSRTIELFINMQPLLGAIWGPIKFCLQIASKLNEAFDTLLDAYEKIGSALPIIQAIDTLFYSRPHVQQVLADIFEDILTFHKRAIVFFSHKTWKLTFRLTFHTFGDMFRDVLKNLERSRELLLQSASIAHFQEAREARMYFTKEYEDRLKREKQERRLGVVEWLSADHAKRASCNQHDELQQRRTEFPLTTQWLFNMSAMRGWKRKSDVLSPIFWLSGIPGAGKTILFSSVVDNIRAAFPDAQVVYFYCKCSDHKRRTFEAVTRTLIANILDLNPACLDYLYEKMTASSERYLSSPRLLQEIIEELCKSHDLLFLCIDGLDECEPNERSIILSLVVSITKASRAEQSVRFFLTSRKESDIEKLLSKAIRLDIKSNHIKNDIYSYVKTQTAKLRDTFAFNITKEQEILEKVSSRPQGMFLLARLIMDNLLAQDNVEDLEEEMDSEILPAGIEQAYDRILVRLSKNRSEKSRQRAKFILDIITSATRTLHCHEVQGALSIRLDNQTIDFDRRRSRVPLTEICGPILEVHSDGVVDMIHPTAKSYLQQHHSGYFIKSQSANLTMAKLCVTYLTFSCFHPMILDSDIEEHAIKGDYSFQEYATCNWIHHVRSSIDYLAGNTTREQETAFRNSYNMLRKLHHHDNTFEHHSPEFVDLVEHRGLVQSELRELAKLYSPPSLFGKDSRNESMPYLLLLLGRARATIENYLFLSNGAKQELLADAYGSAVYKCPILNCSHFLDGFTSKRLRDAHLQRHERPFKCEHEECDYSVIGFSTNATLARHTRLCHEEINDQPVFPRINRCPIDRALNEAIDKDDVAAVRTLAMEVLDLQDSNTGFLTRAINGDKKECALILMEILGEEKEVNHQDADGNTALHLLVMKEDEDEGLVASILATGINVNATNCSSTTALHLAVRRCSLPIVALLLRHRHGKRTLAMHRSPFYLGILYTAVKGGDNRILRLILETGKEIFKDNKEIIHALQQAVFEKKRLLVGTLLVWGRVLGIEREYPLPYKNWILPEVDDMVPVFMGEIPMAQAWEDSREKWEGKIRQSTDENDANRVEELLNGMGINSVSEHITRTHGTALGAACLYDNVFMVQDLLSKGVSVNVTQFDGNSAFENAAANGNESILQLFLNHGHNVNSRTKHYSCGTALQRASENGHASTVEFLLDCGARIDDHGTGPLNSETALIRAVQSPIENVAHSLISRGGDIFARTQSGESVIHVAASRGHQKLLCELIQLGAAVDELTPTGNSVLMMAAANGLRVAIQELLFGHKTVKDQLNLKGGVWQDWDGYNHPSSALFRAASNGHVKTVEVLLQSGAKVDATSEHGHTALAAAQQNGHNATVAMLRSWGATLIYDSLRD